jgi:hypothetical protein
MDIRKKFLKLTKKTYPHGFEDQLASHLPRGYYKDQWGNYYYKIGTSKTAFTCHLDTADRSQSVVNHVIDKNIISTDGKTILGADDKAGVTILLYMIEKNVPGLYCFFIGEERGCIGSGKASDDIWTKDYDRMISFDRRGTKSVITYQSSKRCCSDDFAKELSSRLNKFGMEMAPDDTGVYTDSAEFVGVIPECTNISVGYYKEHTCLEHQDMNHLIKLCISVTKIDWESLPTVRDNSKVEYKSYSYGNYKGYSSYDYESKKSYSTYDSWNGWDKSPSKRSSKKSNGKDYYSDYGYYDTLDEEYYGHTKYNYDLDTGGEGKSRSYFDSLDNDITEKYDKMNNNSPNHYESLKENLYDDTFSYEEVETLKELYFNLDNDEERQEYLSLSTRYTNPYKVK